MFAPWWTWHACRRAGHQVRVCSAGGHFDEVFARYGIQHIEIAHASPSPRALIQV
jgi:hypothetical protein